MDSALIVSNSVKGAEYIEDVLRAASILDIAVLKSCGEARRMLAERDFDLVVVNAPLKDETGESLSRHIAAKGASQVLLLVNSAIYEAVSAVCEGDGVLTISKPVNKTLLWSALKIANAAYNRLSRMQAENNKLRQKIEDIRFVDRAKHLLIAHMNMQEDDAHRYIEKQAMDSRATRRAVAEKIIKAYEDANYL